MKRNATIRMGASKFTVTIHAKDGDTVFDINAMTREQRGKFFGAFRRTMDSYFGGAR